ncbi:response regulator transcription factor [Lampropedia puyangensis]|uniref:Response regulator transcription factor n=2 Tax=Lampropedia puyangensis TaxID=1330072 RepID=A0A4V4GRE6_9BURK|nr:response regulator transcription factor [Lampropedia puyangensis]
MPIAPVAQSIRVLIADDHRIVREGVKQVLADAPEIQVVAEADDGFAALAMVEQMHAQLSVVLLDIAMPKLDGVETLLQLRQRWPALPVLVLSTYAESQYAVHCIRQGAKGYLSKSADPDEMVAAVRQVAAGGLYVTPEAAQALAMAVGRTDGTEALSHREHQVYRLLISGMTVTEIGAKLKLAPNTVSTYRMRVLEKTATKNDVELTLYAQRHGHTG